MQRTPRHVLGGLALLGVAACTPEAPEPTVAGPAESAASAGAVDPAFGAVPEQASLPGLTMDAPATFSGAPDAKGGACVYSAPTGRFVCEPVVRGGLTITRSYAFYDAAGQPQPRRDEATRSANTEVAVKGTLTTDRSSATVDRASSLTVSGLGRGAATHTLNGSEAGKTTGTFTSERGTVTVTETFTATTKDVVVPVPRARDAWPLSGTTTRAFTVTTTRPEGGATRTSTGSEQVTFTGTSVVNVTITRDGVTRSCTRDLAARGTSTCK